MNTEDFTEIVNAFEDARDEESRSLNMHSILIKEDESYLHHFREGEQASDVRSISKTILTLALGRLIKLSQEGKYREITEESYIYPIIKDQIHLKNKSNLKMLQEVKVKHLITHTIGYEDVLMMRDDIADMDPFDYLDYIVNYPIEHESGEYYLYSNAGFYLLSVVLEEFVEEDLTAFLKRELFEPLGIEKFKWEKYGKYLAGATRLWLMPEDLLKFGELFLNHGRVNGEVLISEKWLKKMLMPRTYTKNLDLPGQVFRRNAYGYGIWLAEESFYFGHGTDGQRLIILPEKELIIITLAEQEDTHLIDQLLDHFIKNRINEDTER